MKGLLLSDAHPLCGVTTLANVSLLRRYVEHRPNGKVGAFLPRPVSGSRRLEVKIQTDRPNIRACLRSTLLPLGSDILNAVHPFPRVKTDIFLSEK